MPIPVSEIPIAGVGIDVVTNVAGTMIVLTGLLAAALRAGAVLAKSPPERVEMQTALGFFWGMAMAMVIAYIVGGGLLIARYCAAHEDEMPPLPPRRTHRS